MFRIIVPPQPFHRPCPKGLREQIDYLQSKSWRVSYQEVLEHASEQVGRQVRDLADLSTQEAMDLARWLRQL